MNFLEAVNHQKMHGTAIKRKNQVNYGIVIQRIRNGERIICKFSSVKDVYPLDLEDIMADDWETEDLTYESF